MSSRKYASTGSSRGCALSEREDAPCAVTGRAYGSARTLALRADDVAPAVTFRTDALARAVAFRTGNSVFAVTSFAGDIAASAYAETARGMLSLLCRSIASSRTPHQCRSTLGRLSRSSQSIASSRPDQHRRTWGRAYSHSSCGRYIYAFGQFYISRKWSPGANGAMYAGA